MSKRIITSVLAISVLAAPQLARAGDVSHEKRCSHEAHACLRQMTAKLKSRGWIGIEMDKTKERPVITRVVAGSPAERAGLAAGDAVVAFNGVPVSEGEAVVTEELKKSLLPGNRIALTVERTGKQRQVEVTLAEIPKELLAQWIGQHMLDQHAAASADPSSPAAATP